MSTRTTSLPRETGTVVFDWTPTPADRVTEHDELAERYVVMAIPVAMSGIVLFGMFRGEWVANPSGRAVIRHLLKLTDTPNPAAGREEQR